MIMRLSYLKKFGLKGCAFLAKGRLERYKKNVYSEIKPLPALTAEPFIAVVICGEDNRDRTLRSLEGQSYTNFKITDNPSGELTAFIKSGDELKKNALYLMLEKLLRENADAVYCDEDNFFKPDFSPNTLDSCDYIRSFIIKTEYAEECDFKSIKTVHCDRVLIKSDRQLEPRNEQIAHTDGSVSIIIPSKDNYEALKSCVESIRRKAGGGFEIIVVDNGSEEKTADKCRALADKYIYEKRAFNFSYMCNRGAAAAEGRFLLFLNDDTEVITNDWLAVMKYYAAKEKSGAVGAKLYYPNSKIIQHCGVINIQPGPAHALLGLDEEDKGQGTVPCLGSVFRPYCPSFAPRQRTVPCPACSGVWNYTAVTAACLMVEKSKFIGFDESFKVAYNDVELCIRLLKAGLYNMVVNDVALYHYESLSRGDDRLDREKLKRLALEREHLFDLHPDYAGRDDYYNYNLSPYRADFAQRFYPAFKSRCRVLDKVKAGEFRHKIEYTISGDRVKISGYAFKRGGGCVYVLLERDGKIYRFDTVREMRTDCEALYGRDALLGGFCLVLDCTALPEGEYRVGLMLGGKAVFEALTVKFIKSV